MLRPYALPSIIGAELGQSEEPSTSQLDLRPDACRAKWDAPMFNAVPSSLTPPPSGARIGPLGRPVFMATKSEG